MKKFPNNIMEKIGYYVYALKDPRENNYFYIGKGCRNRVFDHIDQAIHNNKDAKSNHIRSIHNAGLSVETIILRHNLSEAEANLIESVLIDYAGIQKLDNNNNKGTGSSIFGIQSTDEIILHYEPEYIVSANHIILLININNSYNNKLSAEELYDKTRQAWKIDKKRCENIQYAFAVYNDIVREVYKVQKWKKVKASDRLEFEGEVAELEVRNLYLNKSISQISKFNGNPIKYING